MNENAKQLFDTAKSFLGLDASDVEQLRSLKPIVERHGPKITDEFYENLGKQPATLQHIEGRVDQLKRTHQAWMMDLVNGEYGEDYLASRWRIGLAHVRIGLDPYWVEGVMSLIRTRMLEAIAKEVSDPGELAKKQAAFVKICDLDLLIINLSYAEDRLDRLTEFTGMKRNLIENIIRIPRKP